ncbi:MAG: cytochrome c3 family protein [Opitutaceae bacterium]|jgi:predicted CXXCH cytochrome family protein
MISRLRWTKTSFIFGGIALWGLVLIGCVSVNRAVLAPAKIAGAEYVGTKDCAQCHSDQTDHFKNATHAKLALSDPKVGNISCEACHGPGSLHSKAGGGKNNIINPKKSPEACFTCHLDKRGEFSLPNSHPVMSGHVSCVDCHDVHTGNAIKGTGVALESQNETCTNCHTAQKGPFVFEHGAMREGCTACHNPHGTINQKMLIARDANLCLRCHLETQAAAGQINANAIGKPNNHASSRMMQGTCWSSGCHEAVHGSNANNHLRR